MTAREYRITGLNVGQTIARAQTLAARAQKKGLTGGYTVTVETRETTVDDTGSPLYVEGSTFNPQRPATETVLVIDGEAPRFEGWTFVARVEFVNGQPVVTGSPFYEGPQVDRDALSANNCDHCGIRVRRTKTVVVERDGERKQVGTTCLKDFLGHDFSVSWLKDPFAEFEETERTTRAIPVYTLTEVLAAAACVIRQAGFVPASWESATPTRSEVYDLLGLGSTKAVAKARDTFGFPTDADKATAAEALEFGRTMSGDSDYAMNVRAILAGEVVESHRFGLVVSVVGVMVKQRSEQSARKAEATGPAITEELFAEPKTKVEFAEATVAKVIPFTSDYGFGEIIVFIADGFRFKWMTGSAPGWIEEGQTVTLKGTVKGRDEFRGQVSTTLLRCKVEQVSSLVGAS
jgi:hypothetical protein